MRIARRFGSDIIVSNINMYWYFTNIDITKYILYETKDCKIKSVCLTKAFYLYFTVSSISRKVKKQGSFQKENALF